MTIVVLISSPRKGGFGERIALRVAEGAESAGNDVDVIHLNNLVRIRQCQNCGSCKMNGSKCVIDDDAVAVLDAIERADGIVISTSINFNSANGLFKIVLDRMYRFMDANACSTLPKGKKVAIIVTAGADSASAAKEADGLERIMTQHFYCESLGTIAYNTWMMDKDMPVDDDVMERAFGIGTRF